MRKRLFLLLFSVLSVTMVQAQFAKPLKKTGAGEKVFSVGVTGCYAANDMIYSAVHTSKLVPVFAPAAGIAVEWNTLGHFSVGMDASYVIRGTNEIFDIESLTSYTTSTFVHERYNMLLRGVELRVPFTFYLGETSLLRPYVYVAPRFCLWTGGQYRWERSYDDGSVEPLVLDGEVTNAMLRPYDLSAIAGAGICTHLKTSRIQFVAKLDVGYGIGLLNTFSEAEVTGEVSFLGWGNIDPEKLGQRRLQNLEVRLTLLVPLRRPVADACDFNQRLSRPKR